MINYRGLFAFATTTLVLSLFNVHARHITVPNVIVGQALFYGGLAQFVAGMWEFATGNTFGATGQLRFPSASIIPPGGIVSGLTGRLGHHPSRGVSTMSLCFLLL